VPQLRAPYEDAAEFLAATRQVRPDHTGLKEGIDEDGAAIVEVFRNCACGSTLLETFSDRRDQSPGGCGGASASARCSTSWWRTASNTPGPRRAAQAHARPAPRPDRPDPLHQGGAGRLTR
jgi:hypothetical protein